MNKSWPMQLRDMMLAERIMLQFREEEGRLNLFELVVNIKEKSMDYQIAPWVLALVAQFQSSMVMKRAPILCAR